MKVRQVMYDTPETLKFGQTIQDAIDIYKRNQVNCAPIINENKVAGILTVFRVLEALLAGASFNTKVEDIMDTNLISVDEDSSFDEVCQLPIERLLVLNKKQELVGVLTRLELINKVYKALDTTERGLQVILESIQSGIIAVDTRGRISHFNEAAQKITGIDKKFALGKKIDLVFGGTKILKAFKTKTSIYKLKLGRSKVIVKSSPILKEGKNLGSVLIIQDISDIEKISNELDSVKTLNKELNTVIESSSDGIAVFDNSKNILYENSNFRSIVTHFFNADIKTVIEKESAIKNFFTTDNKVSKVITGKDGKELMVTSVAIKNESGQITRYILNFKDMTEINRLRYEAARNNQELKVLRKLQFSDEEIVFESPRMINLFNQVKKIAAVDSTVLISGESGVGKEVIAKQIHINSPRSNGPFIQINCGAIPENLLESELFGYEKGAFTGADREGKIGMLEVANNGTLLLDEIGDMPLNLQVKLLRALQEKEIYRIGGRKAIKLNVRIIAATNRDLEKMVREGKFREDLYYRLNVVPIKIPPLRERKEDILPLAVFFLEKFNKKYDRKCKFAPETSYLLESYSWPGNVRELINIVERLVIMSENNLITPEYLPENFNYHPSTPTTKTANNDELPTLQDAVEKIEASVIKKALDKHGGLRPASRALGVSHATLLRKARKYGLMVQK